MSFGNQTPIDILPIYHISSYCEDFSLLLVDQFLTFNGTSIADMDQQRERFLGVLDNLTRLYEDCPQTLLCSSFMNKFEYLELFGHIKETIKKNKELTQRVLATLPNSLRNTPQAQNYPLHEFACVEYLSRKGFSLKIGPCAEKKYDAIMQELGIPMQFSYILDAFACGVKEPQSVVHYAPHSRGEHNGIRIFLEDTPRVVKAKVQQANEQALSYLAKIATVSGKLLGLEVPCEQEINQLSGRKLKRKVIDAVLTNIVHPYKEVAK